MLKRQARDLDICALLVNTFFTGEALPAEPALLLVHCADLFGDSNNPETIINITVSGSTVQMSLSNRQDEATAQA